MIFQLIAFFNSNEVKNGFSEVYHVEGADYSAAEVSALAMLALRLDMMASDVSLVFARLSDPTVKGDSRIVAANYPLPGTYVDADGVEPLDVALLVRTEATALHRGMREVRAIPEGLIKNQTFSTSVAFTAAFTAWKNILLTGPWRLKVKVGVDLYDYLAYTAVDHNSRVSRRKAGRPFGLYRGRQSV